MHEEREQHEKKLHNARMQQELVVRQRDEARDEAAALRTNARKAKKGSEKEEEEKEKARKKQVRG